MSDGNDLFIKMVANGQCNRERGIPAMMPCSLGDAAWRAEGGNQPGNSTEAGKEAQLPLGWGLPPAPCPLPCPLPPRPPPLPWALQFTAPASGWAATPSGQESGVRRGASVWGAAGQSLSGAGVLLALSLRHLSAFFSSTCFLISPNSEAVPLTFLVKHRFLNFEDKEEIII